MSENAPEQITYRNPVKGAGWAQVYHAITLDDRISHGAYRLLMLYEMHAQQKDLCWPGRQRLAEMLKCSEVTISRYNGELEEAGYITRQRRLGTSSMTYIEDYEQIPYLRELAGAMLSRRITYDTTVISPETPQSYHQCDVKNEEGKNEQEKKTPASVDAIPPEHTEQDAILDFYAGVVPERNQEPTPTTMEKRDVVDDIVQQAARRENVISWLLPGTYCGDHDYKIPLEAFCAVIRRSLDNLGSTRARQWMAELENIAAKENIGTPDRLAIAIKAIRDDWNFVNDRWRTPFNKAFGEQVGLAADRIAMGEFMSDGKQQKGWSTSL